MLALCSTFLCILASSAGFAQGNYNSATQQLTIDAIDLVSGANVTDTLRSTLKVASLVPLRFEVTSLTSTTRPGGNRATYDFGSNKLVVPGVAVDGGPIYRLELEVQRGSVPQMVTVTKAERLSSGKVFNRISTFPVYLNTSITNATAAEIVDVSTDGQTLIYTDSPQKKVGFVNISNPASPQPGGTVDAGGEPTSIAVVDNYALVGVDTSASFTNPSGKLLVIDVASRKIVHTIDLGGQPDSVAVSPDRSYAAVVIENQRDERAGTGAPPQAPAGFLVAVKLSGAPAGWTKSNVALEGLADLFPEDPEPEFVDINSNNIAVVTLQENNHIVLVDLATNKVVTDFSAGKVDLTQIDTVEERPSQLNLTSSLRDVPREPDGVTWINTSMFAIANEGDLNGGSRGFTVMDTSGKVVWESGNALDHEAIRVGHYPDSRSANKGNEPENIDFGMFEGDEFLFIASERASLIFAYNLTDNRLQTLPTGVGPEGIKAIPSRNLLVAATEEDDRSALFRGSLVIYQLQAGAETYPAIRSSNRIDGTPIPWVALSGLAPDREDINTVYTVPDSVLAKSRVYTMDISGHPAIIHDETPLLDTQGKLAAVLPGRVNSDKTVNLDLEGIAQSASGGFWLVSEGAGTVGDAARPVTSNSILVHANRSGHIDKVHALPAGTNAVQQRFGFEGVAAVGAAGAETVYVAFQREWNNDPKGNVRIGRFSEATGTWSFFYYPLDAATSPLGGWVGLSDISVINENEFAVIERDNQGNNDARIKRIYRFSVKGLTPLAEPATGTTPTFPVLSKTLVRDLLPDFRATGYLPLEKIEGMAILNNGQTLINTDNDGVDDSNGENQLLRLNGLFK